MIPPSRGGSLLPICVIIGLTTLCAVSVEAELKLLSVLFRHGDRTPDNNGHEMYPKDPYLHYDFYPTGNGQLTNEGKRREFNLGKMLREKYGDYLGKPYTPKSVWGLSSDYDRTKMSLQLVLAALYPPPSNQKWNPLLNWQPIPTQYVRRTEDNIFLSDDCPLFIGEYAKVVASAEGKKKFSVYNDLMKHLTVATGKNMSHPLDLYNLYNTLTAEYSMGLPLPNWTHGIFPYGRLRDSMITAYELANYTPRLRRLYGGPHIRQVLERMLAFRSGTLKDPRKIYLYSGHESNIASMLFALNLYEPHVPQYSSAVITELHYLDKKYYVKLLHYWGIPPVLKKLTMPGCDVLCPLDKFVELTADVIPSDEELFCDKTLTSEYRSYRSPAEIESMTYNLIRTAKDMSGK